MVLVAILLGSLVLSSIGPGRRPPLGRHVSRSARWLLIAAAGRDAGLDVALAGQRPDGSRSVLGVSFGGSTNR